MDLNNIHDELMERADRAALVRDVAQVARLAMHNNKALRLSVDYEVVGGEGDGGFCYTLFPEELKAEINEALAEIAKRWLEKWRVIPNESLAETNQTSEPHLTTALESIATRWLNQLIRPIGNATAYYTFSGLTFLVDDQNKIVSQTDYGCHAEIVGDEFRIGNPEHLGTHKIIYSWKVEAYQP